AEGEDVIDVILEQMQGNREVEGMNLDLESYNAEVQFLNAANYGVPQRRERVFFVGNRVGEENPDFSEWASHRKPRQGSEKERMVKPKDDPLKVLDKKQRELPDFSENDALEFPNF
ncbi:MAG: DNA cytosine methyltransferase, partial [Candidatus Nanohalobium sp.]